MTTLVLAGHGSHLNGNSSDPVHAHAAELRRRGAFKAVLTCFWKEEPSFARVLDGCDDPEVVVVPVFISNGYFTKTVIPREMRLDGPVTVRDGQCIRYTGPVGADPMLADVIIERALGADARPGDAVAVLGHGTRRESESEKNIYAMAERVRASRRFAEAGAVFLDQEPGMLHVLDIFEARTVVVVPLFIADGWHVGQTIPADLALEGAETRKGGRIVRYTPPVGTHPSVADVIDRLASGVPQVSGRIGELVVTPDAIGVAGGTLLAVPGNREAVAAHVRTDDHGRYRPLSGARTLPTGWKAPLGPGFNADDAIEAVYPLALLHRRQHAEGTLRIVSLDAVLARQSGRYETTSALSEGGRRTAVRTVCGECVRRPVWDGAPCGPGEIPCPEPCSVLVAFCREAALWEAEPPVTVTPDSSVAWAAFEEPGNELREQYLQEMHHADE